MNTTREVDTVAARRHGALSPTRRHFPRLIGGISQEMLDFCAERGIVADIELVGVDQINESYERMFKGDVTYRFVIDNATQAA